MKFLKSKVFLLIVLPLVIFLIIVAGGVFYIYDKPVMHMGYSSLLNSEHKEYFELDNKKIDISVLQKGGDYQFDQIDLTFSGEELWDTFHFYDVSILLPINHSSYVMAPLLEHHGTGSAPTLGLRIFTPSLKARNHFIIEEKSQFNVDVYSQKLFEVPFNYRYLLSLSANNLWRDIFQMDLTSVPENLTYKEYLYRLFVLASRSNLFPEGVKKIGYLSTVNAGIIELPYEDEKFRKEMIWTLRKGVVRKYILVSRYDDNHAEEFRRKFITTIQFSEEDKNSVESIYEDYKKISFEDRISDKGMIYLFSAFTQDWNNRETLQQMIQFLEKGRGNLAQLTPLYNYAFLRYGTNMSRIAARREEEYKARKAREEKERLQERLEKIKYLTIKEEEKKKNFVSPEDEVLHKLNEAKKNPVDIDRDDSKMYVP